MAISSGNLIRIARYIAHYLTLARNRADRLAARLTNLEKLYD